jgi:hypothetical protein
MKEAFRNQGGGDDANIIFGEEGKGYSGLGI